MSSRPIGKDLGLFEHRGMVSSNPPRRNGRWGIKPLIDHPIASMNIILAIPGSD